MGHEDAGHYAGKRPGVRLDERIASRVRAQASGDRISCAEAHRIALELNIDPAEVGTAVDLLEVRIVKCQLGLFGYENGKNIAALSGGLDPDIERAVRSALVNDRLPCLSAWEIAGKFNVSRPIISGSCDLMKIKIYPCQLGAFG